MSPRSMKPLSDELSTLAFAQCENQQQQAVYHITGTGDLNGFRFSGPVLFENLAAFYFCVRACYGCFLLSKYESLLLFGVLKKQPSFCEPFSKDYDRSCSAGSRRWSTETYLRWMISTFCEGLVRDLSKIEVTEIFDQMSNEVVLVGY
uniref:Caspase family p10 domain-containing protein n=1 Tax=Nelumbo nucifera TaxID=4432 RepID=A0A822Z142_NELNU|nr:TPA_asm: hypothetical protein HUJ06_009128 [Nelumbo nucifera]